MPEKAGKKKNPVDHAFGRENYGTPVYTPTPFYV